MLLKTRSTVIHLANSIGHLDALACALCTDSQANLNKNDATKHKRAHQPHKISLERVTEAKNYHTCKLQNRKSLLTKKMANFALNNKQSNVHGSRFKNNTTKEQNKNKIL